MDKNININVKVWRQKGPKAKGHFETYHLENISGGTSFVENVEHFQERSSAGNIIQTIGFEMSFCFGAFLAPHFYVDVYIFVHDCYAL
jgi:hypothetical protein